MELAVRIIGMVSSLGLRYARVIYLKLRLVVPLFVSSPAVRDKRRSTGTGPIHLDQVCCQ